MKIALFRRPSDTDIWHVGIMHRPVGDLLHEEALRSVGITWLPKPGSYRFIADPFGIWRDDKLYIFVEALDYRIKRGEIHFYVYDATFRMIGSGVALQAAHHLSYPQIIEDNGEIYMLPEAQRSCKLTLYKALRFPYEWEPVATLMDIPAIDATVARYQDRWWMFYTLKGPHQRALRELQVAHADVLTGPWTPCANNPVHTGIDCSRPGGMPFMHHGALHLPVQDCTKRYGGAVKVLRIETLEIDSFEAVVDAHLTPTALATNAEGMHTLSGAGNVTLIDVNHVQRSFQRYWIDQYRRIRRVIRID